VIGYTNLNPDFIVSEERPIYLIFGDHTRSFNIAMDNFCVMDNVKVLIPKQIISITILKFIISSWKKCIPNKGYSRHWSIAKDILFSLPIKNTKIDFDFMESFISELETQKIEQLQAYLKVSGLDNYTLTDKEQKVLDDFENIVWEDFRLGDLFEIEKTLSFNQDKLTKGFKYDYVTRTSQNQGILQTTGFVNQKNINLSGVWSLGLLQMDFFYRNKPWYAGQFVRKVVPKIDIRNKNIVHFFTVILNKQKEKLLSGLVRDVNKTFENSIIQLITTSDNQPDYDTMETLISAIKKQVVKDVVLYVENKL